MAMELGTNVVCEVKGKIATLTIDLDKKGSLSGSGKSMVIATTHGYVQVGDVRYSLNVIRKP